MKKLLSALISAAVLALPLAVISTPAAAAITAQNTDGTTAKKPAKAKTTKAKAKNKTAKKKKPAASAAN